ncbi:MAG: hypothetical protein NTX17_10860 [Candidatus Eisenbacteria bacterium]|nr:hypothetical protein [Candidatus Eisenbacteria bacterium]
MMSEKDETRATKRKRAVDVLIAIALLGSVWGFLEVVLGGAIKAAGLPQRAAIMTGLGMGVMGIALGAFRRPLMLVAIPIVAVLCKQLVVPILHVSILCKANSCLAVGLDGFALAAVAGIAGRRMDKGYTIKVVSAASAALLVRGTFYFMGMNLAPCAHLLSFNRAGGFVSFMAYNGLAWAAFSALLFPVGYWIGAQLKEPVLVLGTRRPSLYYVASAVAVILCWGASALAISSGL